MGLCYIQFSLPREKQEEETREPKVEGDTTCNAGVKFPSGSTSQSLSPASPDHSSFSLPGCAFGHVSLWSSEDLFEGSTGCHPWEAGFMLAEFVLSHPELFRGGVGFYKKKGNSVRNGQG